VDAAAQFAAFASSDEVHAKVYVDDESYHEPVLIVESSIPVEVRAERVTAIHVEVD